MSTPTAVARRIGGRELPLPGRWHIDPSHSELSFIARHMMIAKVRGRFRQLSGTLVVGEVPEDSWVEVIIDADSIDTGDANRDQHLRSPDFLDVERYPHILYRSTGVRPLDDDRWIVDGELTVRDLTRPVPLNVEFCGVAVDPWQKVRAAFLATTEINRDDFGVTWNQALESGGFLVGKGVRVEADVEAVLDTAEDRSTG